MEHFKLMLMEYLVYYNIISLSKKPGVDKGPQPLMALFGFGDMRGKSAKALA